MKFLFRISHPLPLHSRLQLLIDSDIASWVLIYTVSGLSIYTSLRILGSLEYFPI